MTSDDEDDAYDPQKGKKKSQAITVKKNEMVERKGFYKIDCNDINTLYNKS